ncbi:hypothetical protein DB313_04735 (plasmid) [Borrelia turcica IST7]|uniref:Uncharacterized protein n=1 Tax=Borrelia turcica IST7 TaxID=1104446 RepID=A0A386PNE7_9SPIR|nr:hypothetical protein [Borrelia turcica]AYE36808.1 hypothetical protein DB313_04735 [Borrelia turcica IST7]
MKKINIMFFLVLSVAIVACNPDSKSGSDDSKKTPTGTEQTGAGQTGATKTGTPETAGTGTPATGGTGAGVTPPPASTGTGTEGTPQTPPAPQVSPFEALKAKRDAYKKELSDRKTAFDGLTSLNKVDIPTQVTTVKPTEDQPKIHASLGYNSDLNKKLDDSIKALKLGDGTKVDEIKVVDDMFIILVSLDEITNKLVDTHLSDENLEKIKSDSQKISSATTALQAFIDKRKTLMDELKKQIEKAAVKKSNTADLKTELEKIGKTTANVTTPGEAGYYFTTVEALKAKVEEIENLFK